MAAGKKEPVVKNTDTPVIVRSLRDNAEEQLARSPKRSPNLTGQKAGELIHELQVHQIELETQAEELRRVQLMLEESRDKYLDLYDFAPIGYLTLSNEALIDEVNLTGATLLGVERSKPDEGLMIPGNTTTHKLLYQAVRRSMSCLTRASRFTSGNGFTIYPSGSTSRILSSVFA